MQSSLYSNVATRQPCSPSASGRAPAARPCCPAALSCTAHPVAPRPSRCSQSLAINVGHHTQRARARGVSLVPSAVQQQHEGMFSSDHDQEPLQAQLPPPEWHPRLFGLKDSKRGALEHSARLYYEEVWNAGSIDLLDEIADAGVCFNDAMGMEADAFSRASLKGVISDFQASHPLLKYELEGVVVDDVRNTVVVHYTVTAAHLLPQLDGSSEATGHVSVVSGMDKLNFTGSGLISSILSFRQRFMEEEAEPINWDTV